MAAQASGKAKTEKAELSAGESVLPLSDGLIIRVEKNLAALGFFSPGKKDLKDPREKIVRFHRIVEGRKTESSVKIVAGGSYGLPGTADLDKFLALQKIISDRKRREGLITNPICFESKELIEMLGLNTRSGKNIKSIEEWLDRMYATTIESNNVVYYAGRKRFAKDRTRVFDRAVSVGREVEEGVTATKNYVWLSEWQLENINSNHLIPLDFQSYRALKYNIAKTLTPLLQVWLYATRKEGVFEKRYDELCQILGIKICRSPSEIERSLKPSLNELTSQGYLASWSLATAKEGDYKIIFKHGERFQVDALIESAEDGDGGSDGGDSPAKVPEAATTNLLDEYKARGIDETGAQMLLTELPSGQPVLEQLDYLDFRVEQLGKRLTNLPGFYITNLRKNISVPADFETRGQRAERETYERAESEQEHLAILLNFAYEQYEKDAIKAHIETNLTPDERAALIAEAKEDLLTRNPNNARKWLNGLTEEQLAHEKRDGAIMANAIQIIKPQVPLKSSEEFATSWKFEPENG